jgi:hypothetical protein
MPSLLRTIACVLRRVARRASAAALFLTVLVTVTTPATPPARAAAPSVFLRGTVTSKGAPVPNAEVTASGNNLTIRATTDARGHFSIALPLGTYRVRATAPGLQGNLVVDLGSGGAIVTVTLQGLKEIGHTITVHASATHGSGSDVTLNSTVLTTMPYSNSFSEMEIQLPGAVRGANGVVHINGDHGVINYQIDGVPLPQELNRDIGGEINLNDISFIDVIEGAYPAQYGLKFGSVLNMTTRAGTGPAGFTANGSFGSYTDAVGTVGYHAPIAGGGGFDLAVTGMTTDRGLDPPDFGSPHNAASSAGQFARFTIPAGGSNFTNVTFIHSNSTYQIPNDVNYGQPASTDDNETQNDTFLAVQFRKAVGQTGTITYGPAFKQANIKDFGDPLNDWAYGEALNVTPPPFGNGGTSTDCAFALKDPSVTYLPTTCGFSLNDDRTSLDYIFQGDYVQEVGPHNELRAGASYDLSRVFKYYAIALQPNNFLAPVLTPETPNAPATVVDNDPNLGNTYQSYIQDSWRPNSEFEADYGLRYDFYTIKSTQFAQAFGAFSPRLKLTRFFGKRASVYAYIGRFFEPPSFENVSPQAAYLLNLPLQPTVAQFDLKPERDTQLEFGGHIPVGSGDLGFRVWQKNANDLIDDTQVGVTLLHQDINYVLGRLSQEAINYVQPLPRNGRAYFSVAHVVSVNKGCETQLLAPCFGSPTDFTPADHEQNWSVAGGALLNDRRGGWTSFTGEYGSGLSSAVCPLDTPGNCKETAHTIFSVEEGVPIAPHTALTFNIQNLLNDRYYVTLLNAQGNHYAAPRIFSLGFRITQ